MSRGHISMLADGSAVPADTLKVEKYTHKHRLILENKKFDAYCEIFVVLNIDFCQKI